MRELAEYDRRFLQTFADVSNSEIADFIGYLNAAREKEKLIAILGNGGSMATSLHLALDLNKAAAGRGKKRFSALTLGDPSAMSAHSNDSSYNIVFSEQLRNYAPNLGLVTVISASGNSRNLIEAVGVAKELNIPSFGLLGFDGGRLKDMVDGKVLVKSEIGDYRVVEDIHLIVCHKVIEYFALN